MDCCFVEKIGSKQWQGMCDRMHGNGNGDEGKRKAKGALQGGALGYYGNYFVMISYIQAVYKLDIYAYMHVCVCVHILSTCVRVLHLSNQPTPKGGKCGEGGTHHFMKWQITCSACTGCCCCCHKLQLVQQTTLSDACVNNNKEAHTHTQATTQRSILLRARCAAAAALSLFLFSLTLPCSGSLIYYLSLSQKISATAQSCRNYRLCELSDRFLCVCVCVRCVPVSIVS